MLSWPTKHSATAFTPNFMMFGREVSEPVDLVVGLPLDPDTAPSAPVYVQQLIERLELAHQVTRDGESVKWVTRQYDKNCCRTQYNVGGPCGTSSKVLRKSRSARVHGLLLF